MAHDVFISYASKDKAVADALCAALEDQKIRCWIAPRDILAGVPYGEALIEALNASSIMVLVFSASSNNSPQVSREMERAASKGIPIIPFKIEDVPLSKAMEYFISSPHWLDAMTLPLEKHIHSLVESVKALLARSHSTVPASPEKPLSTTTPPPAAKIPAFDDFSNPPKSAWLKIFICVAILAGICVAGYFYLQTKRNQPAQPAVQTNNVPQEIPKPPTPVATPAVSNQIAVSVQPVATNSQPAEIPPPPSPVADTNSGNQTYHVPGSVGGTLDSERAEIESAQTTLQTLDAQVAEMDSEIETNRASLDRTSQTALDAFNAKVDKRNALAQKAKDANDALNAKVDDYNAKVKQYGK